jgi:hypothetical protein
MITEPTSRDKIERSLVIQEPIPSILAIGQSIVVATQVRLRSGSAYQGVHSGADHAMRGIRRSLMLAGSMGLVKLGQPHPDSYLSEEAQTKARPIQCRRRYRVPCYANTCPYSEVPCRFAALPETVQASAEKWLPAFFCSCANWCPMVTSINTRVSSEPSSNPSTRRQNWP